MSAAYVFASIAVLLCCTLILAIWFIIVQSDRINSLHTKIRLGDCEYEMLLTKFNDATAQNAAFIRTLRSTVSVLKADLKDSKKSYTDVETIVILRTRVYERP